MTIRPLNPSLQSIPRKIVLWDYFLQSKTVRIPVYQRFSCNMLDIMQKKCVLFKVSLKKMNLSETTVADMTILQFYYLVFL